MRTERAPVRRGVTHAVMMVLVIANLFPLFWMVSSALKGPTELFTPRLQLLPRAPTLENFRIVMSEYDFLHWLKNSVVTTIGISVGQVAVCVLAAFAVVYFKTRYGAFVFYFLIATMVIPFQVTMIPNYILVSRLGFLNTAAAVIVPSIASASTFFFLRQSIRAIPPVLYEAAMIEGAGSFWSLLNVVLPLAKSPISAMFILCAIDGWNLYFWPLLVLSSPATRTLTVGLQQFLDHEAGNRWGPFMATATLASIPVILLYVIIQRRIIEAFMSSGING